jgi:L,D-peptidoglycan transpeptidase YkuD (ErfK/YbiS/YcfS/YnhG family)
MIRQIHVRALSARCKTGLLTAGNLNVRCAVGRSGFKVLKREGDGATPKGTWALRRLILRSDKMRFVSTTLPSRLLRRDDGWCETPDDPRYNQPVKLPYGAGADHMWREDDLYDAIVVLSHNDRPRLRNFGSAVFFHIAQPDFGPTAGCVAVTKKDMRKILKLIGAKTHMRIW